MPSHVEIACVRSRDSSRVTLGNESDGGYALKAALTVVIPGFDLVAAETLTQKAHQMCPYSKAMRGNIEIEVKTVAA